MRRESANASRTCANLPESVANALRMRRELSRIRRESARTESRTFANRIRRESANLSAQNHCKFDANARRCGGHSVSSDPDARALLACPPPHLVHVLLTRRRRRGSAPTWGGGAVAVSGGRVRRATVCEGGGSWFDGASSHIRARRLVVPVGRVVGYSRSRFECCIDGNLFVT
eukprot:4618141-Prymnesium_polylepis.1